MSTAELTEFDVHLWSEGSHYRAYQKLGAHLTKRKGVEGTQFAVWAPNARWVSVVGDFNSWEPGKHPLKPVGSSGIWEGFVPGIGVGTLYKFAIFSKYHNYWVEKADPYAFATELRPRTASKVWDLSGHEWGDQEWMSRRHTAHTLDAPISIYEVHLASWRRKPEEGHRWLTYREMAEQLADYCHDLGYTHIELLPITEHPFDASWGYQTVGYYAPTSRFGTPQDFMYFVDTLHRRGIGVILDWVPAHFPRDEHGLGYFDGTHLYEHEDPRLGQHTDWGTFIYNYGRTEVSNFLISNALFWLDKYHLDGLRVDAVASMLYLDYSRKPGEWVPNRYGGRENLDAINFLRRLNEQVYGEYPDVMTVAEESTAWPGVSRPGYLGGLGFGYKWDMGWMHDTLDYLSHDPVHRKYHHDRLTFRMLYAFTENYMLPLSHDEVVHGKGALLAKMPGDDWQKFANLRLLYGWQYAQPGKKLLFMGGEIGQWQEWHHDSSVDWHLLQWEPHQGIQRWVRDLNTIYRGTPALHQHDCDPAGFEWVDCCDWQTSIVSLIRKGRNPEEMILAVFNFTPVPRHDYRVGVPRGGRWDEVLNSDAPIYGGSGQGNYGGVAAEAIAHHGREFSLNLTVPPLGVVMFRPSEQESEPEA
ncbi:MAG TPA: 1,4-alpha-glucan branching protein GlgB [Gemmataceae bacterium]|nr:1,4-alpha-glucan branching protein GlgB [Gemmataceae bacterium]